VTDEKRAVEKFAEYCLMFGHAPDSLIGMRYPGVESAPMTKELAAQIGRKMEHFAPDPGVENAIH
jgi:hypothetical protein